MLNEFPHAIAMQHANQPDETIFQAEAQCIRIITNPCHLIVQFLNNVGTSITNFNNYQLPLKWQVRSPLQFVPFTLFCSDLFSHNSWLCSKFLDYQDSYFNQKRSWNSHCFDNGVSVQVTITQVLTIKYNAGMA